MKSLLVFSISLLLMWGCASNASNTPETSSDKVSAGILVNGKGFPHNISGHGQTMIIKDISKDPTYGYTKENPIKLGGFKDDNGSILQQVYLNSIYGPNGENIEYERRGSCCPYYTPNGIDGFGLLDVYELKFNGMKEPIILYITMYEEGDILVPKDLTTH